MTDVRDPADSGADVPASPAEVPSSAWISTPPPRQGRSLLSTIVTIGAVLIGLVVLAVVIGINSGLLQPRGYVVFGTSAGKDLCSVGDEVRSVTSSTPVYFAAVLRHQLGADASVRLRVTRDGQAFSDVVDPPDGREFDCYGSREPYGLLEPGVYIFEISHEGEVEATGTLTVA